MGGAQPQTTLRNANEHRLTAYAPPRAGMAAVRVAGPELRRFAGTVVYHAAIGGRRNAVDREQRWPRRRLRSRRRSPCREPQSWSNRLGPYRSSRLGRPEPGPNRESHAPPETPNGRNQTRPKQLWNQAPPDGASKTIIGRCVHSKVGTRQKRGSHFCKPPFPGKFQQPDQRLLNWKLRRALGAARISCAPPRAGSRVRKPPGLSAARSVGS